jgi:hypothetical protein
VVVGEEGLMAGAAGGSDFTKGRRRPQMWWHIGAGARSMTRPGGCVAPVDVIAQQ